MNQTQETQLSDHDSIATPIYPHKDYVIIMAQVWMRSRSLSFYMHLDDL